ncbi:hypothetical protein EAX61_05345 [Dokdonia sinensis]|uniref:TonB C-terminal domain-containing protein n=1 Tax=Dokdonia sinensis TaxID=2479847 RepID=A0A3M0G792_9FLAO|nr:hypothetical protein [Dokdonia sinensis]RMB60910.1 hypothetical protein EAX61_05345 [Dokdonia sinensis]
MKTNFFVIAGMLFFSAFAKAQTHYDYRQDSLQFKMYTRLYIGEKLEVDSLTVKKIFCDFCSEKQMDVLQQEAMRQSMLERYNPKYRKPGEHRLALVVRFSKKDFKNLNEQNE